MIVPEPPQGAACNASDFPGSGFHAGDPVDTDAMNYMAEVYGWRCRFYLVPNDPGVVHRYQAVEA